VVLEVDPKYQMTPDALESVYVITSTGAQVPLSSIAHFGPSTTSLAVAHQGQFPAVTISFNLNPGESLGEATRIIEQAQLQMRFPGSIHGSFQGTAAAFQDSLSSQPLLILAALVAVYIVLGMLYESYIHPITILSTIPSAGTGALLALMLFHMELNVIGLVGILLLIGIVKKNAIMMIDFALERERQGKTPLDAIHERPLGIAIVGGLMVSQMLTIYTTPVVYLYMDRVQAWFLSILPWRRKQLEKKEEVPIFAD